MSWELFDTTPVFAERKFFYLEIGCSLKTQNATYQEAILEKEGVGILVNPLESVEILKTHHQASDEITLLNCFDFICLSVKVFFYQN